MGIDLFLSTQRSGEVVAIMSNGAFGGIHEKLMVELS
jgi:hypothetical protein